MLKYIPHIALLALVTCSTSYAQEEAAVKDVIIKAYLEGAHMNSDAEAMRDGFHPNFIMFVNRDDKVSQVPIADWAGRVEASKKNNPDRPKPNIEYDFPMVSIAENTAVARIEVKRDGNHIFTDFMSLYKIQGEWRIIGKVFQSYR
ncbi:MAG: nuclear transport factor 2 family protein [Bacteroidota bacterium]